ncbi:OprD family porin [Pseudomonas helleri]|uniref:Outer membrane porin, OprD family n=1 Tax=Pseudomonas helleri TaxID=1608996 RepID=A0A6A7Z441_9PSED|nr:OprD family porin [Pseudomonas helleri]MQT25925.1 outer membrane porin, OprD family [Pseudomonas helleri]MQT82436.1 outer membrane porin, OprD family [Pseudomonas helleri]MQU16750.1 outer membrane porin, OprD family [Pseudomonas helleri]MQU26291.1 outer membrane porin, OprD family [Pseudomonas helleri]
MLNKRIGLIALGVLSATQAMANDQAEAQGFVEDSHLNVLVRNAYISRDYKHHKQDKAEWGQGFLGTFTSGFTQGTVGVGVDAFGIYALRLDGGRGNSGAGGIDFFKQGDSGKAARDIAKAGAAVKVRVSNTVLKYGDQMPALPVLMYDNSRLMPESYTGTLLTSKEIDGLELNVGRFTAESRKSAEGRDSGDLKRIDVFGGSYKFTDNFTASLYGSEMKDELRKQYLGMTYVLALPDKQSLTFDFNGYRTHLNEDYARDVLKLDGQDNKIWSLASTYAFDAHTVTLAFQSSTGEIGYPYGGYRNAEGVGDGGNTILLANSYWSDFNAKDERSWQLGYGFDFGSVGIPGLTYNIAYVRGTNIDDGTGRGRGTEREIFNQAKYVVQSGPVKDLSVRLRGSWLRVSNNASAYNVGGNEVRVYVDYPISIF